MKELLDKYKEAKPISTYFPVKMPTGGSISSVSARCPDCKSKSDDYLFRGTVVIAFDAVIVDGYGYCKNCNHLYHVLARYREIDGNLDASYLTGEGQWATGLKRVGKGIGSKFKKFLYRFK